MKGRPSDTNKLIKMHTAAIIIQQSYRRHLQEKGFYQDEDESSSDDNSQMYVDSDEDQHQYKFDETTEKK